MNNEEKTSYEPIPRGIDLILSPEGDWISGRLYELRLALRIHIELKNFDHSREVRFLSSRWL
jgi:hypothetical protein